MFDSVRKHQKILQLILLLLILPSFVFLGVSSYTGSGTNDSDVAKVGGDVITGTEFDNALKSQAQRAGIPLEMTNSSAFKNNVLNQMIQQKLLRSELKALHLQVSDARLAKELLQFPEIQALKKPDGTIDADKYRLLLQSNGLSISQFQDIKKAELMSADLQFAIAAKQESVNSEVVSQKLISAYGIEREVQVMFFLADQYRQFIKVEPQEAKDYFQAHPSDFQTTPTVDVEYVVLHRDPKFDEKEYSKTADAFANTVYEQADSLRPVADTLHLKVEKISGLTAQGLARLDKAHPLNQAKTLKAVFSDEVIKSNKNTDAIQLPNGDLVSVHVTQYNASKTQNYEDVRSGIEKIVSSKKAEEMAIKIGSDQAEQLQKDPKMQVSGKEFSKPIWVSRVKPLDLAGEPLEKVFGVDPKELPKVVYAKIPGSGIAIYRINQTRSSSQDSKVQIEQFKQIAELNLQNELSAYFANMRDRHTVKLLKSMQ
jgi:hypothetical protein